MSTLLLVGNPCLLSGFKSFATETHAYSNMTRSVFGDLDANCHIGFKSVFERSRQSQKVYEHDDSVWIVAPGLLDDGDLMVCGECGECL